MVETGRTITINGTTNQIVSSAGGQTLASNRTWTLSLPQNIHTGATPTFAGLILTGGSLTARAAATQDGVIIAGRAGGTGDFDVTITPTTLSADRTLTLADGNTTLVAGTMLTTSRTISTTGGITGGGDLSADRTFTIADGALTNAKLLNSSITINGNAVSLGGSTTITAANPNALTIGTGLSGTSYNGSTAVTIANTGVLSITSNTGLSSNVSATGNVTITNTGVTSVAGTTNQISVSAATGGVTISTPQNIHTAATPTFARQTLSGTPTVWSSTTPGTSVGDLHLGSASGTANAGFAISFGARDASSGANGQAGIYINSDGSYGTRMYIATTDSYATGARTAISINEGGAVSILRSGLTLSADSTSISFSSGTGAKTISTGGSTDLFLNPGGNVRIGTAGTSVAAKLQVGGDIRATGEVVAYAASDRRLKDNIQKIESPLTIINNISGYTFDWNENQKTYTGKEYGVIAQEIEEVMPELVITRENGYKAVNYEKIIPLLIESIKEQQNAIVAQQTEIRELRELINNILNK
jgi:hypothetical protein